jgi:hypothetical protein
MQIKSFCCTKGTMKRMKSWAQTRQKQLAGCISNRGLASRIHKEFSKCGNKTTQRRKWENIWIHASPKKTYRWQKNVKTDSPPSQISTSETKRGKGMHCPCVRIAKDKHREYQVSTRLQSNWNSHTLLWGCKMMQLLCKTFNPFLQSWASSDIRPNVPLLGMSLKMWKPLIIQDVNKCIWLLLCWNKTKMSFNG